MALIKNFWENPKIGKILLAETTVIIGDVEMGKITAFGIMHR